MVATRFAWPYGGNQVFLSASFTGWTKHLPMTSVEGSSTVFQAIYNLDPGYYQYKFLVDGVWRVDQHKPYITDESGVANNIILVKEPTLESPILLPDPSSSSNSNMDVDNGHNNIPLAAGIRGNWVDTLRRNVTLLLSKYTAYDLLPESGKVIVLDVKLPVKQAFHIMHEQKLAVVPIRDDHNGQFCGMLSAADFILILKELHDNGSMLTNEELEMHTISAWKEGKYQLNREHDGPATQESWRHLIQADPDESLEVVAKRILQNKISTVPIIHVPQDGTHPLLLHVVCLSGILKQICRHLRYSSGNFPLLQQPVGSLGLGTWVRGGGERLLSILWPNDPLSSALSLLVADDISSIPIVDDNGSLLDVYSRSDITSLAAASAYARIRLDQTSMHQALQLVYEATGGVNAHRHCRTCLSSDSLFEVMERLCDPVVRRLIVIEAGSKRVEGVISVRDVVSFLLG